MQQRPWMLVTLVVQTISQSTSSISFQRSTGAGCLFARPWNVLWAGGKVNHHHDFVSKFTPPPVHGSSLPRFVLSEFHDDLPFRHHSSTPDQSGPSGRIYGR
jgi:hypothetical protein